MATFPLALVFELYIDGAWVDITSDVRYESGAAITRGRANEQSRASHSRCGLAINNRDGKYSPRNPSSIYYGLIGRNTELRVRVDGTNTVLDTFTRTETNGWGTADNGLVWDPENTADSDYSCNGTVGLQSNGSVNSSRFTFLDSGMRHPDVTVTVSAPVLATGAPIRAGLVIRAADIQNQYTAWLLMRTDQTMHLEVHKIVANVLTVLDTDTTTGLTHAAGTQYKVRFQATGTALKAKCWLAASAEPAAWNLEVTDSALTTGSYGCRSRLDTGNTNTLPVAISFDDLQSNVNVRFHGEVSQWPPKWDITGTDVYVPIEACGILRRLGQGASPLRSQLRRGIPTGANIEAYWPMEEEAGATQFAEYTGTRPALKSTGADATIAAGSATYAGLGGSEPLPVISPGAKFAGFVPAHTATAWTVQYIAYVPASVSADTVLLEWRTGGSPSRWRVKLGSGAPNSIALQGFDAADVLVVDNVVSFVDAITGVTAIGRWVLLTCEARQDGSAIDYSIEWDFSEGAGSSGLEGTTASSTVGAVTSVNLPSAPAILDGYSLGHIKVRSASAGFFGGTDDQYMGALEEPAGDRLARLCEEEGVPFQLVGDAAGTESMGPQSIATLLDLLNEAADADGGILYEPRDRLGLSYRTKRSLYNQTAALALDYSLAHLSGSVEPVDDDQHVRNDVTVERRGGSSGRAVQETGPLNVQDPADDPQGVGRYDEKVTLDLFADDQSGQIATWRRHLGTWDEARYPTVSVNLARSVFTANSALSTSAASVDIGDHLTIDNPPAWLPPDLIEQLAQGLREYLNKFEWSIAWNCSPAGPYLVVGVYDTSRYDTAGCELAEDLTTTETLADVTTTLGPVWADPGAGSFDLNIGGERVTCTDVSGVGAAQTLTLTRSVNGVVKTHSTGAAVSLWRPARYAL